MKTREKCMLVLNLIPETRFKILGTGETKDWKSCATPGGTTEGNWQQVSKMICLSRVLLLYPESLTVKMGRGLPLCERLQGQLEQQLTNNVSQCGTEASGDFIIYSTYS